MRLVGLVVLSMLASPLGVLPLSAQRLERTQSGITRVEPPTTAFVAIRLQAVAERKRPIARWPFIVGGAVVGGAIAGTRLAREVGRSEDGMIMPFAYMGGVVAAGAGIGAFGGWVVSVAVRRGD